MRFRRLLPVAGVAAALVSPLAALAGTVTTAPLGQPAPALAMPMIVALAVALIGLGIYRIRTHSAETATGFALLVGLSLLAGLSYATIPPVIIKDADCYVQKMNDYDSEGPGATLTSQCPNPIEIVAIDKECGDDIEGNVVGDLPLPLCIVGEILTTNGICRLPYCPTP